MLKHVDKHWRQFKHSLKKARFNPEIRSKQEIYDDIPEGHSRDNWRNLVKYWYSDKGQKLAANGREARALQNHLHTTGARSYANKRADFVEEKGREPGSIEWFEVTHETKDKNFVEGKITKQFLEDAKTEVEKILANSSSPKNRVEVENEVFNKLMYKEEIPKRPVGFGFGVNSSDVYGVHGMLRKSGYNCANKSHIEAAFANIMKENQELRKKNEAVESKLDVNQQLLIQLLNEMRNRNGHVSDDFLDNAQSVLKRGKSQVPDASSGYGARRTTESGDQSGSDDHRSSSSFHED